MGEDDRNSEQTSCEEAPAERVGVSTEELFRALASRRRRRSLSILLHTDGESTIDELANALAGWDASERGKTTTPEDQRRIVTALYHVDLPMLAEMGLVDYDRENNTVAFEPHDDAITELLAKSVDREHPTED